jgi:hypothetical protein
VPLPHDQSFYDDQAADMQHDMLTSVAETMEHSQMDHNGPHSGVTAGTGAIVATGGGSDTLSLMRFTHPAKTVHVGDTLDWTNDDPVTAHTITFGAAEPANAIPAFSQCHRGSGWGTARDREFAE